MAYATRLLAKIPHKSKQPNHSTRVLKKVKEFFINALLGWKFLVFLIYLTVRDIIGPYFIVNENMIKVSNICERF